MVVYVCIFIVLLFFKCTILYANDDYVEDGLNHFCKMVFKCEILVVMMFE